MRATMRAFDNAHAAYVIFSSRCRRPRRFVYAHAANAQPRRCRVAFAWPRYASCRRAAAIERAAAYNAQDLRGAHMRGSASARA